MLLLTESPVDLAIVDLMMPITGGLQFLRWLRTERRSSLPVIVYTGHDNPTKLEAAYNAGADRVLVKPAGLEDLVAEINALLASRSKPTADPHPLLCATSAAASLGLI
jgi:DNA-binding response OmpR family regulator